MCRFAILSWLMLLSGDLASGASPVKGEILIPAGAAILGCNEGSGLPCEENERPRRSVELAAFYIDRTEATAGDYAACVAADGCTAPVVDYSGCTFGKKGLERHPINCLTLEQTEAYCRFVNKRLPTNDEWERAARGEKGFRFIWGDSLPSQKERRINLEGDHDGFERTAPVGALAKDVSPHGVRDMGGNVAERVSPTATGETFVRGGTWNDYPLGARASRRMLHGSGFGSPGVGVRCARSP